MYQVVINDKYYVSDVGGTNCGTLFARNWIVEEFKTTNNKYKAMFFEDESEANSIGEQVGGKVIEYIEKKDTQIEIKCNVDLEEVCKQLERLIND